MQRWKRSEVDFCECGFLTAEDGDWVMFEDVLKEEQDKLDKQVTGFLVRATGQQIKAFVEFFETWPALSMFANIQYAVLKAKESWKYKHERQAR